MGGLSGVTNFVFLAFIRDRLEGEKPLKKRVSGGMIAQLFTHWATNIVSSQVDVI